MVEGFKIQNRFCFGMQLQQFLEKHSLRNKVEQKV